MLYDVLRKYRSYLEEKYSKETARTYYIRLCNLFEGQDIFGNGSNLNIEKVLNNLANIEHKNHFSQCKNALLHYCEFMNISLPVDVLNDIKELENKTRKKYRKQKPVDFNLLDKKIKHIQNRKLKLSFQAMLATGLRVAEVAGVKPSDCVISDNEIIFSIIAKGGDSESVTIQKSEYPKLYQNMKELIEKTLSNKKVFYSAVYLQSQAKELDFSCHDLRRCFAKIEYKKRKSKEEVMKKLRHSSLKNTNIYLKSKIKIE